MSQRDSGYQRIELDNYETPEWVTEIIVPEIRERLKPSGVVYEPAAGSGKMLAVLAKHFNCDADDISGGRDFLKCTHYNQSAIVTNPPYQHAAAFIERALLLTEPHGFVAMLLRTDFDHAQGRQHLFSACEEFAKKIVLTRRIKWFEDSNGAPSFNHAWFVWDHRHQGPPTLAYANGKNGAGSADLE
jgi:hypothetical protein